MNKLEKTYKNLNIKAINIKTINTKISKEYKNIKISSK